MNTQSSFGLAVMVVTWAAIALLSLIVVSLHVRLQRFERSAESQLRTAPFRELLGKLISDLAPGVLPGSGRRMVLFVSAQCSACERVLDELASMDLVVPVSVAWTGTRPSISPLPHTTEGVERGDELADRLGIRVTPFAVMTERDGRIVEAAPVNTLEAFRRVLTQPAVL